MNTNINTIDGKKITSSEWALTRRGYSLSEIRRVCDHRIYPPSVDDMKGKPIYPGTNDKDGPK